MREDAFILEITNNQEIVQIQEPITIIEESLKIREQKMRKDYISNEKFDEEVDKTFHNIIIKDE